MVSPTGLPTSNAVAKDSRERTELLSKVKPDQEAQSARRTAVDAAAHAHGLPRSCGLSACYHPQDYEGLAGGIQLDYLSPRPNENLPNFLLSLLRKLQRSRIMWDAVDAKGESAMKRISKIALVALMGLATVCGVSADTSRQTGSSSTHIKWGSKRLTGTYGITIQAPGIGPKGCPPHCG